MKTSHTPGPWKYDPATDTVYVAGDLLMICKIATGENQTEEEANGYAIAAVPAMIEALQLVLKEIQVEQPFRRLRTVRERAYVALRKAGVRA